MYLVSLKESLEEREEEFYNSEEYSYEYEVRSCRRFRFRRDDVERCVTT